VIYINASDSPWTGGLEQRRAGGGPGAEIYQTQCGVCHGQNRGGSPPEFPSLVDISERKTDAEVAATIHNGKGRMPAFPSITDEQVNQLLGFFKTDPASDTLPPPAPPQEASKPEHVVSPLGAGAKLAKDYVFTGYRKFEDQEGYPAVKPPWVP
jgi:quinoprotein glucose dehydrogenase